MITCYIESMAFFDYSSVILPNKNLSNLAKQKRFILLKNVKFGYYLERVFLFRFRAKFNFINIINELKLFIVTVIDSASLRLSPISALNTKECNKMKKRSSKVHDQSLLEIGI